MYIDHIQVFFVDNFLKINWMYMIVNIQYMYVSALVRVHVHVHVWYVTSHMLDFEIKQNFILGCCLLIIQIINLLLPV